MIDKRFKTLLLDTFKYTVSICEKYNLKYYVAAGSALGAVRHHDIIPWDDDIDIYMPRDDYEKFRSISHQYISEEYEILSLDNDGYYLPFIKVSNKNTTIWENKMYPFILGVFVDVFPLDRVDANIEEIHKMVHTYKIKYRNFLRSICNYSINDLCNMLSHGHIRSFLKSVLKITYFRIKREKYLQEFREYDKSMNNPQGDYLVVFGGSYGVKEIYQREWFLDTVEMDFADMKVKIPKGYDEYLSYLYGDYMTLPPREKQVNKHPHYFIDLSQRLSIREIKNRKCACEKK